MGIVTLIISLLILIYFVLKQKGKIVSPFLLFYALWSFIILLSNFHLYNMNSPSSESYYLILTMEVFFFVGYLVVYLFSKNKTSKVTLNVNYKPVYKLIYCLAILSIILNLIDCFIVFKQYSSGIPMWQIRNWSLEPYGSVNPILSRRTFIEELLRTLILTPFNLLIYPMAAYTLFNSKDQKHKIVLLILSFVILFTSSLAGAGGRLAYIYYFGCFLLSFVLFYRQNRKKETFKHILKKYKKWLLLFGACGIFVVFILTFIRTGPGNFLKQIYTYFALAPTLLTEWLPEIKSIPHTYGLLTFFGIHSYFFRFLEKIGLTQFIPEIYNNSYQSILNAEIFRDVGYGSANAFVSPVYYFMIDGGYVFVCIASLLFGIIVQCFYERCNKSINLRLFLFYALVMYGVFVSFMRIQTAIPNYIISFVLCFLLFKKEEKKWYDES